MKIRTAAFTDKGRVLEIYALAKSGMKANGIDQWQDGYPNAESFESDVHEGISLICEEEGNIIATAAAYIGHEQTYDEIHQGRWLTDNNEYGIIHRIAVDPLARKSGVASCVIEYVRSLCIESSVTSMRCDTHRDNAIMQHTLEKNGYKFCGIIYLENGDERFGYEKLV